MSENKGFNLAELLKNVPKLDTADGRRQIEYIDMDRLKDDPRNFYKLSDLDALADNIATVGLQQPLVVRSDPEEDGAYIIVSGHRRRAAVRKLVEDGREDLRRLPCLVDSAGESPALQELRLIFANSGTRKLTDAEISAQADRVQELLYKLKDEGFDFPGRMRDHVAEACQVSKSKLARLGVIKAGLSEAFRPGWEAGKIKESAAYALARMPAALQERIAAITKGGDVNGNALELLQKRVENGAPMWDGGTLTCPDGTACTHASGFLRHAIDAGDYDCDGTKCCLECSRGANCNYYACNRMCAKAKAAKKARAAEARDKEERAEKRRITRSQQATIPNARRILRAADAAGLSDDTPIPWEYGGDVSVKALRRWADGDFSEGWNRYWDETKLSPKSLRLPYKAAKTLECSADYLLGLTDELHPGDAPAGYITDRDPDGPTDAVAIFDLGDGLDLYRSFVRWDGKRWNFPFAATIDSPCVGWYPIPPRPELPEKVEDEDEIPEDVPEDVNSWGLCSTGASPSGACASAACCDAPAECCAECDEDCNMRCGWISREGGKDDKA